VRDTIDQGVKLLLVHEMLHGEGEDERFGDEISEMRINNRDNKWNQLLNI